MYNWLVKTNAECRVIIFKDDYKLKHHIAEYLLGTFLFKTKHIKETEKDKLLAKVKKLEKDNESLQKLVNQTYSFYLGKEVSKIKVNNEIVERDESIKVESDVFDMSDTRFIEEFEKNEEMLKKYYNTPTPVDTL
jgi:hypothetical protein